jgi:hypothetical protein
MVAAKVFEGGVYPKTSEHVKGAMSDHAHDP